LAVGNKSEINNKLTSAKDGIISVFINLMVISACVYLITRAVFIRAGAEDIFGLFMSFALIAGEAFIMFHAIAYSIDYIYATKKKEPPRKEIEDWDNAPSVAILMPARHEPYGVLEQTLICLQKINYPNKTIYFLDDSSDEKFLLEAEELALTYGAKLFRRKDRHGAKAGIINDCVKELSDDYIVVFDADQNPMQNFLKTLIPVIEANPKLAFIQTPQFYTNTEESSVAFGANLQHCMFYEYMCEGKSARGGMILCGTNAIIRTAALRDIGGLDETSITEDFSTSVDWHSKGWESLYYGQAFVYGEGPTTISPYFKQQWRWARGNLGVLKKIVKLFFTNPFCMNLSQWWEYFATGSYYLIGGAYLLLMLCPLAYIFLRTPSFFIVPEVYMLTFIPYFAMSFTIFYTSMRKRNYKLPQLTTGVLLGFISFPVYLHAAFAALLNRKSSFTVTEKDKQNSVAPWALFKFQIFMLLVHASAVVWGINRFLYERDFSVLMSLVWVVYHMLMLSSVFFFRYAAVDSEQIRLEV
jgi:cellulose synthase (UDP-forming)